MERMRLLVFLHRQKQCNAGDNNPYQNELFHILEFDSLAFPLLAFLARRTAYPFAKNHNK